MGLRAFVKVMDPLPQRMAFSYQPWGYSRYGICFWEYEGPYYGPIHWINWKQSCFEPEFINPKAFNYWLERDILATVSMTPIIDENIQDQVIQGVAVNLLTGRGLPFIPPG